MNSCTINSDFSKDAYRLYWRVLYRTLAAAILVLFATAIYLDPISGDLTRLGGYPENLFGWTIPQSRFSPHLYDTGIYNQYHDIVVFGDSFSAKHSEEQTDVGTYWQNFLAHRTGMSVIVFNSRKTIIGDVIENPIYKSRPPRIFIFQHVERDLIYAAQDFAMEQQNGSECKAQPLKIQEPLDLHPLAVEPEEFDRSAVYLPLASNFPVLELDQAANVLKRRIVDDILGLRRSDTIRLTLKHQNLFSSAASDQFLFYRNELRKNNWRDLEIHKTKCRLVTLQNRLQADGRTLALTMVAPDRLTAYSHHIDDPTYANLSKLESFDTSGLQMVRVDKPLIRAIDGGLKDVYLPNDTHWGVQGHRIVADEVFKSLQTYKAIR
ncbi:MAG: hypothetical protein KDI83_13970 [Gammaproteobacteria bacterium]|nr:hypothetical protein [Gammaproteobacteria bacterium]